MFLTVRRRSIGLFANDAGCRGGAAVAFGNTRHASRQAICRNAAELEAQAGSTWRAHGNCWNDTRVNGPPRGGTFAGQPV
jgi:hypothetical protein